MIRGVDFNMARRAKVEKVNTINIKSEPVQAHIGSLKWTNDDWGTIAFLIDRRELQNRFADKELRYNCLYFLIGYEGSTEMVYVGQAKKRNNGESVLARLREHATSNTESYRDQWDWVIVVTNKDDSWGLDDLNALEHAFYAEIPAEQCLNGNNPNSGGADYSLYADKIIQIKSYVTSIGFNIFAETTDTDSIQVTSITNEYSVVEDLQNGMARIPEIVTPDKVVKAMVDMLPVDVWNSRTTFLDPACKGGEYLREIYDRLMDCELLQSEFPNAIERSNHILKNQIYGIALSKVSLDRTAKKLLGEDRNLRIITNYISKLKGFNLGVRPDGSQNSIGDILNKEFGKEMKFDVVIGNPPYQENDGSGLDGGSALYDKFMQLGDNIADIVSMIVPMRWMVQYRVKGINSEWVHRELHCNQYTHLMYDEESKNIFNGVNIRGGVIYFIKNRNYTGKCKLGIIGTNEVVERYLVSTDDIVAIGGVAYGFITNNTEELILEKTHSKNTFDMIVGSTNEFGLESNSVTIGTSLTLYKSFGEIDSCDLSELPKGHNFVAMYKVIIGRTFGSGKKGERLPVPRILGPNEVCTGSLLMVGKSFDRSYCENVSKYMQTKFMALLVGMRKSTHHATKEAYKFVPLQDFTSTSDIDWSKSVAEIDQQLYKKYGLTQEEIDYIEKTIKPME